MRFVLADKPPFTEAPAAFTATDTPLTTSKIPLTTRHYG